jgi:aspartyl protease family protein
MLKNAILFAIGGTLLVALAPVLLPMLNTGAAPTRPATVNSDSASIGVAPAPSRSATGFRELALAADSRGQYYTDAMIKGVPVHFLVDTGASFVSLSPDTADRLGIVEQANAPHYRMQTANGDVAAYGATLDAVDLGPIYVKDVDAVINPGMRGVNLLGANFLKRLASVEQRDGQLILKQ